MALLEYSRDEGQVCSIVLYHPKEDLAERRREIGARVVSSTCTRTAVLLRVRRADDGLTEGTRRVPKKKKDDMSVNKTDSVEREGDSRTRGQDPGVAQRRKTPTGRVTHCSLVSLESV